MNPDNYRIQNPEVNFNSEVWEILWTNAVGHKEKIVKIRDNFLA